MNGCKAGIFLLVWCFTQSLIFPSTALAQTPSFAQRLYGMWYTYPLGNPATDSIRHEFRNNSETGANELVVSTICPGDYLAVISKVTSPIEVSEKTIKVLKSFSHSEKKPDGSECLASIEAGVWNYVISSKGDRISITKPHGSPGSFQLARQDVVPEEIEPPNIFGSWLMPAHLEHGNMVQIKLIFYESADPDQGNIREISSCSKENDSLVAQANSKFKITKDQITILEAASRLERNGPISCEATITPGTLSYVMSADGGSLILSKPDAPPIVLTRER
jgi:hypothetical protein